MKNKPKIGQTLYLLESDFRRRYKEKEEELEPVKVAKVGRKYFTIERYGRDVQFDIEGWNQKTEYNSTISLYESKKERAEEKEFNEKLEKIQKTFGTWGRGKDLSLGSLRKIYNIIQDKL